MIPVIVWKIATPFIAAGLTGAIKQLVAEYGKKIPSWLKPIIAAVIGAATGLVTGDPSALASSAAEGFALGGGAPMVREIKEKIKPSPMTDGECG